jgi:hypothetical protein
MKRLLSATATMALISIGLASVGTVITSGRAEATYARSRGERSAERSHAARTATRSACRGVHVRARKGLVAAAASAPAGTTFCLGKGTYTIRSTVMLETDDRIVGKGPTKTAIRPAAADTPVVGFSATLNTGVVAFSRVDLAKFRASPTATCGQCGAAIGSAQETGGWISLSRVRCHDNGTYCIGSGANGNIRANQLNCYENGYHAGSLDDPAGRSSSCIKMFGGSLTLRNSFIHDNDWNGVWCDFCDQTTWIIEDNILNKNGHAAVQWEISGQLDTDTAVVRHNVINRNGWQIVAADSYTSSGVIVSGGRNITIVENVIHGNRYVESPEGSSLVCCRGVWVLDDDRASWEPNLQNVVIRNNDMDGDDIVGCQYEGVTC